MSKLKPGDKVRILTRLQGQRNQSPYYVDEMTKFAGKESVIREKFRGDEWFELDNSEYTWHEEWLELVDKPFTKGGETMTNIEKVNKALAGADEDKIKEVLDFLGYKEDSKFVPKHSERCYYISGGGVYPTYYDNYSSHDEYKLLMNNVYRTREEAEQALDFQTRKAKLLKEIEDSSDVIDWNDVNQKKYYFWVSRLTNSLRVHGSSSPQTQGATLTTDKLFLEELIATRSTEVKELLFDIK